MRGKKKNYYYYKTEYKHSAPPSELAKLYLKSIEVFPKVVPIAIIAVCFFILNEN